MIMVIMVIIMVMIMMILIIISMIFIIIIINIVITIYHDLSIIYNIIWEETCFHPYLLKAIYQSDPESYGKPKNFDKE